MEGLLAVECGGLFSTLNSEPPTNSDKMKYYGKLYGDQRGQRTRYWDTGKTGKDWEDIEQERDRYASMLCEAMRWVYVCEVTNQNRADMIARFEVLELTPALSLENAIGDSVG